MGVFRLIFMLMSIPYSHFDGAHLRPPAAAASEVLTPLVYYLGDRFQAQCSRTGHRVVRNNLYLSPCVGCPVAL